MMPLLPRNPLRRRFGGRRLPLWCRLAIPGVGLLTALWPLLVWASEPRPYWNPGDPYSPITQPHSPEVYEISVLFWIVLALSGIIFFGVVAAIIMGMTRFRARPGDTAEPVQVFGNRRVELLWTAIPTLILLVAFIATVKVMQDINSAGSSKQAVFDVNAIGHQWWWEFQYPKLGIDTADEVHVPSGAYVHFHVESYDVIHSFWTPQLQRQIDANPGQDNAVFLKANTPGVYSGACYEYCGTAHAWMKFHEVVQTPAQFNAWVKHEQQPAGSVSGEAALGKKVFFSNTCINCHAITYPKGQPQAGGAVGPNLTHFASRWTIGAGAAPVSLSTLEQWIQNPNTYKPGVVMPGYPYLPPKKLHALAVYLLTLK